MTEAAARTEDWTTPGIYEVARDVYRIPLPLPNDGLRAVNVYVVVEEDRLVCIDSGWSLPDSRRQFGEALMWNGLSSTPRDLTREEFLGAVDHQRVVDR